MVHNLFCDAQMTVPSGVCIICVSVVVMAEFIQSLSAFCLPNPDGPLTLQFEETLIRYAYTSHLREQGVRLPKERIATSSSL